MLRRFLRTFGYISLLLIVIVIGAGIWYRDAITRLMAVNTLFEEDRIVRNFSAMDQAFLTTPINAPEAAALSKSETLLLPAGLEDWMASRRVTSLVVLQGGDVVFETYRLGTTPQDLRVGWSISKSYLSALTGILVEQGDIGSLDDRVIDYVPALRNGAYHRATIRNVLNMATGVTFDEDYDNPNSDINRMGRVLALGQKMDTFASELTETFQDPGTDWNYVSIDTHVLAMVLRGATGRGIADLMEDKIFDPLGATRSPYYLTDGSGTAFALGGINATTRDYARFGQMFLQGGTWNSKQIVPADWVETSTTASAPTAPDEMGYGYQWWIPWDARPREYMARGIYGQYLYINEEADTVIALTAVDPAYRQRATVEENLAMFREIADAI
ncbi:MAG: serine hydrolase [Pseudomonadota bacterium]